MFVHEEQRTSTSQILKSTSCWNKVLPDFFVDWLKLWIMKFGSDSCLQMMLGPRQDFLPLCGQWKEAVRRTLRLVNAKFPRKHHCCPAQDSILWDGRISGGSSIAVLKWCKPGFWRVSKSWSKNYCFHEFSWILQICCVGLVFGGFFWAVMAS